MPSVSELNRQIEKATSAYSHYSDLASTYRRKVATAREKLQTSKASLKETEKALSDLKWYQYTKKKLAKDEIEDLKSDVSKYQNAYDRYSVSAANYAGLRNEQYDKWQTLNSQLAQSKATNSEPASSNSSSSGSSSKKDSDGDGVVTADDVMVEAGGLACENDSKTETLNSKDGIQFGIGGIGLTGMAEAFGVGITVSLLFVFDDDGKAAIAYSIGYKGGPVPAASVGIDILWANADSIYALEGNSVGGGGSIDVGASVGADVGTVLYEGENKMVIDISIGLGISLLAGEGHANLENTGFIWERENNK